MTAEDDDKKIVRLPPPTMPPDLAQQVRRLSYPDIPLQPEHDPRAADWLERKRKRISKPASKQDCIDWLTLVGAGLNGVTCEMIDLRADAVWLMCSGFPGLVWSNATVLSMWKRTRFLPTPGECFEVFTAYLAPILAEIAALERIAAAPVQQTPPTKLPPYKPPLPPDWALQAPADAAAERRAALARVAAAQLAAKLKAGDATPPDADR